MRVASIKNPASRDAGFSVCARSACCSGFAGRRERPSGLRVQRCLGGRCCCSRRGSRLFRGFLRSGLFRSFLFRSRLFRGFLRSRLFLGYFFGCFFRSRLFGCCFFGGGLFGCCFFGGGLFSCRLFSCCLFGCRLSCGCFFGGGLLGGYFFSGRFLCSCHYYLLFKLININEEALRTLCGHRSDPCGWAKAQPHECCDPRAAWLCGRSCIAGKSHLKTTLAVAFNPRKARHPTGIRSRGFQRSCALSSGQSFRSSKGRGFPHSGKALPGRSAWRGDSRCSAGSP